MVGLIIFITKIFLTFKPVFRLILMNSLIAKFLGTSPLAAYIGHKAIQRLFCFSNKVIELFKAWLINITQYLSIN